MARGESPGDPCYEVGESRFADSQTYLLLFIYGPRSHIDYVGQWVVLYNQHPKFRQCVRVGGRVKVCCSAVDMNC